MTQTFTAPSLITKPPRQQLASLFAELSNVDEAGLESIEDEGSTAAVLSVKFYRQIAAKARAAFTPNTIWPRRLQIAPT
jgi:hypothetical protein